MGLKMLSRRKFLSLGAGMSASLALNLTVRPTKSASPTAFSSTKLASGLIDPYAGAIPIVFPLAHEGYKSPVSDNWHLKREGQLYPWSHATSLIHRGHDGIDLFPPKNPNLAPIVYSPVAGKLVAICSRSDNTLAASVNYQASTTNPPPWDYSTAIDSAAHLPLYGNFVWIYSTEVASQGYFICLAHLQNEPIYLQRLQLDQLVSTSTPLGLVGDSGNAQGTPQLHFEIHYPASHYFKCQHCPLERGLTALNPAASLQTALPRIL